MDLTKPVPFEAIIVAILFFVVITVAGIFFVNRYRRKS
jgi:hypothetical protein